MEIKEVNNDELKMISHWQEADRIELHTCRPVVNGKRIETSPQIFHYLYFEESIAEPVGNIFYFEVNERNSSCEFGYKINPEFRNKGFGKKMLSLFVSHLFNTKNFNKLYCQTAAFNIPSLKMLEQIGFKRDGILREHHELNGKLWDDYIYSILRSDWFKKS